MPSFSLNMTVEDAREFLANSNVSQQTKDSINLQIDRYLHSLDKMQNRDMYSLQREHSKKK